ncbi:ABC transporter permease [Candidatus Galacturonibacter soehngenii]|uniref:Transport permease protein n=1 Tax=Candidatus Galacturonatibacter soehngenii TaxID=2307010 RepID=A0A7V7QJ28_9FIRM|nr:ABC transporter permease [Candidatus Galacturonibacter soehngenii]KAB1435976.1 transporter [Candidatus Galacturonibacter soehngenii]MBA4686288.1 ABC transporter permease [Candidatus Galacturonibacter soehngenii]
MSTVVALWKRGLKAFIRNKTGLIFSLIFPFFFVYVFGAIFKNDFIENPIAYMLSGVIITTVFESALNLASSTVDDMVSGFMKEVLVSPAKRIYVALGQLLSAATVATLQGILILVVGLFIGIEFHDITTPIYVLVSMIFIGIVFSGVGLFMATKVRNGQTFQIIKTAVTMPLTFLSGAYVPLSLLPGTLKFVAYFNPMTYATAFFRMIILEKTNLSTAELIKEGLVVDINGFIITPFMTFVVILIIGVAFLLLSTISFVKTDFSKLNRSAMDGNAIWS